MAQAIRELIRYLKQPMQRIDVPRTIRKMTTIRYTGRDKIIGRRHYLKSTIDYPANFGTRMRVNLTRRETGEKIVRQIYIDHEDLRTPAELHQSLLEAWESKYPEYQITKSTPVYGRESARVLESRAADLYTS